MTDKSYIFQDLVEANDKRITRVEQIVLRYEAIIEQVGLYEMSAGDHETGLQPEETLNAIMNIIEYGNPAGDDT